MTTPSYINSKPEFTPLITTGQLRARVRSLAKKISSDYPGGELTMVGILQGSFMFVADLARELQRHSLALTIDFINLSSYGSGSRTTGKVRLLQGLQVEIADRHILLIDDILDSGHTLHFAGHYLRRRHPKSLRACVLLSKETQRVKSCAVDYIGFAIPDRFVVGYGLDHAGRYRELPFIAHGSK